MSLSTSRKRLPLVLIAVFYLSFFDKIISQELDKDSVSFFINKISKIENLPIDSTIYYYDKIIEHTDTYRAFQYRRKKFKYFVIKGMKDEADKQLQEILELSTNLQSSKVLKGLLYLDVGYYYYFFNQYEAAYRSILKGKLILETVTDEEIAEYSKIYHCKKCDKFSLLEPAYFNLGTIDLENGNPKEAEEYFKNSLKYSVKKKDKQGIIDAKINLASILYEYKKYDKAIDSFNQLLLENDTLSLYDTSLIYYNLSMNYFENGDLKEACRNIDKSIELSESIGDRVQLIDLLLLKAKIEHKLGDNDKAYFALNKSYEEAIRINDFQILAEIYKLMAVLDIDANNFKKANDVLLKLNTVRDSLEKKHVRNLLDKIELEIKLEEQEQKNKIKDHILKQETAQNKRYLTLIILGLILFSLLALSYYLSKLSYNKTLAIEKQKKKIKDIKDKNQRRLEELEKEHLKSEISANKRELMVSEMFKKERQQRLELINKKIDSLLQNSIITKENLLKLKDFIIRQSNHLDQNELTQRKIVGTRMDFFEKLLEDYPTLTKTDIKILTYLRIGLSTKEIADVQNVSIDAVRKSRYRIRKKLNLDKSESLEKFLLKYH